MTLAERIWYGDDMLAGLSRVALAPFEGLFRAGVAARGVAFDRGLLRTEDVAIPALGVGNLTVGGTGKTPATAWMAAQLRASGGNPGVVLRGVGDDEPQVHRELNPEIPAIADPDRVRGIEAAHRAGCDVVVLDDAFQHRRARRLADVVLVSADRWRTPVRLLPAGPWREPLSALRRSALVVVTRKAASPERAEALRSLLAHWTGGDRTAVAAIRVERLQAVIGEDMLALPVLAGRRVLAVSGIADPSAFAAQLRQVGADVVASPFPDHHRFTAADVSRLAVRAGASDFVVCTLKDAVKLRALWPPSAPRLWYVSQRFDVESGGEVMASLLQRLLEARGSHTD